MISSLTSAQANDNDLDITIVSQYKTFKEPLYEFPKSVRYVYLKECPYEGSPASFRRLKLLLKNIFHVRKFFQKNDFDIILSLAFPNTFMLLLAGVKMSKVISAEHTYYAYYNSCIRLLRNTIYKRCRAVVVLTNTDKRFFTKYLDKVYVIPNPISLANRKYSGSLDGRIISVGRLEREKGYDVSNDRHALSSAAKNGYLEIVKLLIDKGAEFKNDRHALMYASENGYFDIVKYLIELGTYVNMRDYSYRTALLYSAGSGHLNIVKYLVSQGADINIMGDKYGITPLSNAARNGHLEVVKYLIEKGADIKNDRHAFSDASKNGHLEIVNLLKNY